nr:NAD-binding protein [Bordetella sp. BOR01]
MKLKMITNHLVAVHNVATAEALSLAFLAGLDLRLVHELIADGPASSGIFSFRGPLMIEGRYDTPTMRLDVFQKDLDIINAYARELHARTPLFDAGAAVYRSALVQGNASEDVSAVFRVLSQAETTALSDTQDPP